MTDRNRAWETLLERLLVSSRWLLAPFFVGLALGVVILLIKFVQEFFRLAFRAFSVSESAAILGVLTLVDLALTGALVTGPSAWARSTSRRSRSNCWARLWRSRPSSC